MTGNSAPVVVRRFGLSSPDFQNFATDKWKLLFLAALAVVIYVPAAFLTDVPLAVVVSAMGGALPVLWLTAPAHVALDSAAVSNGERSPRSKQVRSGFQRGMLDAAAAEVAAMAGCGSHSRAVWDRMAGAGTNQLP